MDKYVWINVFSFLNPTLKNILNIIFLQKSHLSLSKNHNFIKMCRKKVIKFEDKNLRDIKKTIFPFTISVDFTYFKRINLDNLMFYKHFMIILVNFEQLESVSKFFEKKLNLEKRIGTKKKNKSSSKIIKTIQFH